MLICMNEVGIEKVKHVTHVDKLSSVRFISISLFRVADVLFAQRVAYVQGSIFVYDI